MANTAIFERMVGDLRHRGISAGAIADLRERWPDAPETACPLCMLNNETGHLALVKENDEVESLACQTCHETIDLSEPDHVRTSPLLVSSFPIARHHSPVASYRAGVAEVARSEKRDNSMQRQTNNLEQPISTPRAGCTAKLLKRVEIGLCLAPARHDS